MIHADSDRAEAARLLAVPIEHDIYFHIVRLGRRQDTTDGLPSDGDFGPYSLWRWLRPACTDCGSKQCLSRGGFSTSWKSRSSRIGRFAMQSDTHLAALAFQTVTPKTTLRLPQHGQWQRLRDAKHVSKNEKVNSEVNHVPRMPFAIAGRFLPVCRDGPAYMARAK